MNEIITAKLSDEIKDRLREKLNVLECGLTECSLNNLDNNVNIKYIESEGNMISFCIYSRMNKKLLFEDLEMISHYYDEDFYKHYKKYIKNINNENMIYIYYIESLLPEKGYGQKILNSIFKLKKDIILFSKPESEEFWQINGFENVFGFEYLYTNE